MRALARFVMATLISVVLAGALAAAPPPTPIEDLVEEADLIAIATVISVDQADSNQQPDRLHLEVRETLWGPPLTRITTGFFSGAWGLPTPSTGTTYVFFLRKTPAGWFGVRPDGYRSQAQRDTATRLAQVRRNPRLFLNSEARLQLAALRFLKPNAGDRARILELLADPDLEMQLRSLRALAQIDREAAGEWLFANWPNQDNKRFMRFLAVAGELLGRPLHAVVDSPEDRARAIELYRLAFWLARPQTRERVLGSLPDIAAEAASDEPGWAIEALSLFPAEMALLPMADALEKVDEEWIGRLLALVDQAITRPRPAVRKLLAGSGGARLRSALETVSRRSYSHPSLKAFLPGEARRLLQVLSRDN